jgi:hypothetical protein
MWEQAVTRTADENSLQQLLLFLRFATHGELQGCHYEPGEGLSGGRQDPGALEAGGNWQWVNAEGYFMDSLGNPTGYPAWQSGEPNNAIDQENALEFFGFGSGFSPEPLWNDFPEAGRILTGIYYLPRGFMVEKETVFTTLPEWYNPQWHYLPLIVSP